MEGVWKCVLDCQLGVTELKDGMAVVDATGAKRTVTAELLDDLQPGDYDDSRGRGDREDKWR